jgi:hypothetical protein
VNEDSPIAIDNDPVVRALAGDASSAVYGGSLREIGLYPRETALGVASNQNSGMPLTFLIGALVFVVISFSFW